MTPTEYKGQKVGAWPELLTREPFHRECLTDVRRRDDPDATILNAEFASNPLFANLDVDTVPKLPRFKEADCQLIEGTKP